MKITRPGSGYNIGHKGLDPFANWIKFYRSTQMSESCLFTQNYYLEL